MLPKLTEMERNWIIFTPAPAMVLSKIFNWSIWGKAISNSWEKIKLAIPREQNYVAWLVKNDKTVSSTLTQNFFVSIRQAGKQVLDLQSSFLRILDTFLPFSVVILVKYTVLFVLGKCLMDSEQVILIFTEVWLYNFHVSR